MKYCTTPSSKLWPRGQSSERDRNVARHDQLQQLVDRNVQLPPKVAVELHVLRKKLFG